MPRHLLILPLLFLTACSAYHPLKEGVGFTELSIPPDSFRITYAGSGEATVSQAHQFALIRTAELAALHDDPYFKIQDEQILITYARHYFPATETRNIEGATGRGFGAGILVQHGYQPGRAETLTIPEVQLQIQVLPNPTPASLPASYILHQALDQKIPLSPGVQHHLASLPTPATPVTIPAPPPPTTRLAP